MTALPDAPTWRRALPSPEESPVLVRGTEIPLLLMTWKKSRYTPGGSWVTTTTTFSTEELAQLFATWKLEYRSIKDLL